MIPLENIISASRGSGTKIAVATMSEDDISEQISLNWRRGDDPPDVNLLNYSVSIHLKQKKKNKIGPTYPILEYSEVTGLEAIVQR